MSALTEAAVYDALRTVQEPELGGDLVSRNMVKEVSIDGSRVAFTIELTTPACPLKDEIEANVRSALGAIGAGEIAIVPDERGASAGAEDSDELRAEAREIEPVKRLRCRDESDSRDDQDSTHHRPRA